MFKVSLCICISDKKAPGHVIVVRPRVARNPPVISGLSRRHWGTSPILSKEVPGSEAFLFGAALLVGDFEDAVLLRADDLLRAIEGGYHWPSWRSNRYLPRQFMKLQITSHYLLTGEDHTTLRSSLM
jgi:hypothetical protein